MCGVFTSERPGNIMTISLTNNIRDVQRDLSDFARNQIPFATSKAINATVNDVHKNETARLDKVIDRPTPFTRKAYAKRWSSKRNLVGSVFAKDIQRGYLKYLERRAVRFPKNRAIVIPRAVRLNKYGNMSRGAVKRALASNRTFTGTPKGHPGGPGIYRRTGRGGRGRIVKLIDYVSSATYSRPVLRFQMTAERTARAQFVVHFERSFREALRTAN